MPPTRSACPGPHPTWPWALPAVGHPPTSLDTLWQCLTTHWVKTFFLTSNLNLPAFSSVCAARVCMSEDLLLSHQRLNPHRSLENSITQCLQKKARTSEKILEDCLKYKLPGNLNVWTTDSSEQLLHYRNIFPVYIWLHKYLTGSQHQNMEMPYRGHTYITHSKTLLEDKKYMLG